MEVSPPGSQKTSVSLDVLTYEAPFLMEKLLKDAIIETIEEGEQLFMEVKRWMLLGRLDKSKSWQMYSVRIDEVWHQFVLFTEEYMKFCKVYFGSYLGHAPGNAPGTKEMDESLTGSISEFAQVYQKLFNRVLPDVWYDEKSITVNRRILNRNAGKLILEEDDQMIHMSNGNGDILFSINLFARPAMEFIVSTKVFYVRELPGGLTVGEKIQLISTMVEYHILRVAS